VRSAALKGLKGSKHWTQRLLPHLERLLKDDDKWVRRAAVYALHHLGQKAIRYLKPVFRDSQYYVHYAAIRVLFSLRAPPTSRLMAMRLGLSSPNGYSRRTAGRYIVKLLKKQIFAGVLLGGTLPTRQLRHKALAMAHIDNRGLATARLLYPRHHLLGFLGGVGLDDVQSWWQDHPRMKTARRRVARLLGDLCHPGAVPHLLHALRHDKAPQVRAQAALSLGRLDPIARATTPHLHQALSDGDIMVQHAARHALQRLQRPLTAPQDDVDKVLADQCMNVAWGLSLGRRLLGARPPAPPQKKKR